MTLGTDSLFAVGFGFASWLTFVSTFRQVDKSARRIAFAFAIWLLSLRLRDIGFGGLVPLASLVFRFGHSRLLRPLGLPEVRFPDREYEFFLYRIQSAPQSKTLRKSGHVAPCSEAREVSSIRTEFFILHDARSIRTGTSFSGAIDGGQRLSPKVAAQCALSYRSVSNIVCCAKTNLNRRSLQFVGLNRERITR